jgi:hypothetical protein
VPATAEPALLINAVAADGDHLARNGYRGIGENDAIKLQAHPSLAEETAGVIIFREAARQVGPAGKGRAAELPQLADAAYDRVIYLHGLRGKVWFVQRTIHKSPCGKDRFLRAKICGCPQTHDDEK